MCRLSWNPGASVSWNPQGLSRPVMGLLYLFTLFLRPSLHFTTLHSTSLHLSILYSTKLHYTSLHLSTLHSTKLQYTSLHLSTLHSTKLHHTSLHLSTLHSTKLHYTSLHLSTLHFHSYKNFTHLLNFKLSAKWSINLIIQYYLQNAGWSGLVPSCG